MHTKFLVDFDTKRYIAYDHDLQKQYIDYFFSLELNLGSYETLPEGEFTEDDNLFAHLAFKENLWPLYHDINNRLINLLPLQAKAIYLYEKIGSHCYDLDVTNTPNLFSIVKEKIGEGVLVHGLFMLPDSQIDNLIRNKIKDIYIQWCDTYNKSIVDKKRKVIRGM